MGFSALFRSLILIVLIASILTMLLSQVNAGSFPLIFTAVIGEYYCWMPHHFFLLLLLCCCCFFFFHKRNLDRILLISDMHGMWAVDLNPVMLLLLLLLFFFFLPYDLVFITLFPKTATCAFPFKYTSANRLGHD
jgi:hypothetical protein